MDRARLAGRLFMLATAFVTGAVLVFAFGLAPCPAAAVPMVSGVALLAGVIAVLAFADVLCGVRVSTEDDVVVVRLGVCGYLRIPRGCIRAVRHAYRVRPVLRLGGTAVPGVYYSGYYSLSGGTRAYIFSERLEDVAEVELGDGTLVYLGGDAPEKLGEARGGFGGATGGCLAASTHRRLWVLLAASSAAYIAAGLALVASSRVSAGGLLAGLIPYTVMGATAALLVILQRLLARRDPVSATLAALTSVALLLLGLGILAMHTLCPARG